MKTFLSLIALAAGLSVAGAQDFIANLTGAQDGGGARIGSGIFNLTLTGTTMTLSGSYSGLSAPATAGHIHGPGAPGVSVGVIYNLAGSGNLTIGATSGTLSGTVDLVPLAGGSYTVASQIADLNNGLWYFNVHDANFPGGEIRGQILPVPEPSTLALAGLGLGGLMVWRLRRRKD